MFVSTGKRQSNFPPILPAITVCFCDACTHTRTSAGKEDLASGGHWSERLLHLHVVRHVLFHGERAEKDRSHTCLLHFQLHELGGGLQLLLHHFLGELLVCVSVCVVILPVKKSEWKGRGGREEKEREREILYAHHYQ